MAVTTEKSDQITNHEATPPVMTNVADWGGKKIVRYFSFTQGAAAGDATSTVDLITLPKGDLSIWVPDCVIKYSAFGASRVLDVGYNAYTDIGGDAVAADPNAMEDDLDVSGAGTSRMSTGLRVNIQSKTDVTILATVAGGTIPAAATLEGYITYSYN